ncbi:MAG TPA: hypothetical protein VMG08_03610 [Allosphingosinicella sp.]|nr:hypothetical protein [Allosphingosinicella sp.]
MISRFPDGVTGAALLLLRLSCALTAWPAFARLWPETSWWPSAIPSTLIALALILGLGTRAAAALLLLSLAAGLLTAQGEVLLLLLGSAGCVGALALLGPGAWSIDAHRFGRRVIRVEARPPDRGNAG